MKKIQYNKTSSHMKKLLHIFIVFVSCFVGVGTINEVLAIDDCEDLNISVTHDIQNQYYEGAGPVYNHFYITLEGLASNRVYKLREYGHPGVGGYEETLTYNTDETGSVTFNSTPAFFDPPAAYDLFLSGQGIPGECALPSFTVLEIEDGFRCANVSIWQTNSEGEVCTFLNNGCINEQGEYNITATIVDYYGNPAANAPIIFDVEGGDNDNDVHTDENGVATSTLDVPEAGEHTLRVRFDASFEFENPILCEVEFEVFINCECEVTGEDDFPPPPIGPPPEGGESEFSLCKQIPEEFADQRAACLECVEGGLDDEANRGVWTAVGCIKRDPEEIVQKLLQVGLGISGGVALLTFLAAGFIFSTSQGDPKAYGKAKEMMTSSIVGILFVLFSVVILQFIGYTVFKIPGFGG